MKKIVTAIIAIMVAFVAMVGSLTISDQKAQAASNKKVLVVYFSRTKGVYGGTLSRGNTARVADFIKERTNADTFEIVPKKSYPSSYTKTTQVAQREQNEDARPAIKGKLPDVSKYDTIFIGGPIWWGEYPMVVRTFLDREKGLNGKTLIPFTTNEGSGLGNTSEVLRQQFPKSKIRKGFTVRGNTVKNNPASVRTKVNNWLKGLGY